jgi:hypothetical protein
VPPNPDVHLNVAEHLENIQQGLSELAGSDSQRPLGFNDGTVFPPADYPEGISNSDIS